MILDEKLEIADNLSVAAAAGSALVGDVINLDTASRRLTPEMLFLLIQVTEAFAGSGATVQFKLMSDDAAAINTSTGSLHVQTGAIPIAQLTVGKYIAIRLPSGHPPYEQYLGLVVTTAGATTTAGKINAMLVNDVQDWVALSEGQS